MSFLNWSSNKLLSFGLRCYLVLLPWQTIFIVRTVFIQGSKWEYGTVGLYVSEIFLFALLAFAFYQKKIILKNISKSAWFLLAYVIIMMFMVRDRILVVQSLLHAVGAVGFFLLLRSSILSRTEIISWLVRGAVLPSILGLYQFFFQSSFTTSWLGLSFHDPSAAGSAVVVSDTLGRWLRAYGPMSHPNVFGGYLVVVILLYLQNNFRKSWWCRSSVLIITMALVFTFSRSAWAVLILGLVILTFSIWRQKNINDQLIDVYAVSLMVVVMISLVFGLVQNRLLIRSASEVRSITERASGILEAKQIIQNHLMIGVGWGNYTANLIQENPGHPGWSYQPVHLVPLLILAEWGILGLCFIVFFLYSLRKMFWQITRVREAHLFFGIFLSGFLIIALSDHYFYTSYIGNIVMVLFLYGALSTVHPHQGISQKKIG